MSAALDTDLLIASGFVALLVAAAGRRYLRCARRSRARWPAPARREAHGAYRSAPSGPRAGPRPPAEIRVAAMLSLLAGVLWAPWAVVAVASLELSRSPVGVWLLAMALPGSIYSLVLWRFGPALLRAERGSGRRGRYLSLLSVGYGLWIAGHLFAGRALFGASLGQRLVEAGAIHAAVLSLVGASLWRASQSVERPAAQSSEQPA